MRVAVAYVASDTGQCLYTVVEVKDKAEAAEIRFIHGQQA